MSAEVATQLGILVGGEWQIGERMLVDLDPTHPDRPLATFTAATAADVAAAYDAAEAALPAWRARSALERGALLRRASELLRADAQEIATDLTREEGKTLPEALGEVGRAADILDYYAGETAQPSGEVYPSVAAERFLYTVREPLGVVCAITPWNFPIAIPAWKIAPAIAFGNTVVWKPSELTPLTAVHFAKALERAGLPPGVLNLVTGDPAEIGAALTDDPRVVAISFTGSGPVGRAIHRRVVERGVKVQLELGGKNPIVVLADSDLDAAVRWTIDGAMMSSGQKCTATSRALVDRAVADEFLAKLVDRCAQLRVGDPLAPGVDLGPLVSEPQLRRVESYLDVARREGLEIAAGGAVPDGPGYFVEPTIFADVPRTSVLAREEVFGPVLSVLPIDGFEEAIDVANAVEHGLSASLFTRDLGLAFRFSRAVEAGIVHINSGTAMAEPHVPFGGVKQSSSHSREQGKSAADFYTQIKTIYLDMP